MGSNAIIRQRTSLNMTVYKVIVSTVISSNPIANANFKYGDEHITVRFLH